MIDCQHISIWKEKNRQQKIQKEYINSRSSSPSTCIRIGLNQHAHSQKKKYPFVTSPNFYNDKHNAFLASFHWARKVSKKKYPSNHKMHYKDHITLTVWKKTALQQNWRKSKWKKKTENPTHYNTCIHKMQFICMLCHAAQMKQIYKRADVVD